MKGLFIALEGIDYSGKDTQALKLANWLQNKGFDVDSSNEPNDGEQGSPLGHTIRKILQGEKSKPSNDFEFQRLYVLDRGQDVFSFIRPSLEKGHIYIIIRYAHSTIAYGMLSGRPAEEFIQLHKEIIGPQIIWPDITILLDVSGKEAAARLARAQNKPELFEKKDKLEAIRQNYLKLANYPLFKNSTVVVNGEQDESEVFRDILKMVQIKIDEKIQFLSGVY